MTSVSCLVDETLNFTIFTAFIALPVKGYDTNSVLTFKKLEETKNSVKQMRFVKIGESKMLEKCLRK